MSDLEIDRLTPAFKATFKRTGKKEAVDLLDAAKIFVDKTSAKSLDVTVTIRGATVKTGKLHD